VVSGGQLWVSRYNGPFSSNDLASAVAVGPGGGTVFVTGSSQEQHADGQATVATTPPPAPSGG
jgi:hypothetical protein